MSKERKQYSSEFKAKIALATIQAPLLRTPLVKRSTTCDSVHQAHHPQPKTSTKILKKQYGFSITTIHASAYISVKQKYL